MERSSQNTQLALSSLNGSVILQMLPFNKCQSSPSEPDCCHKLPFHVMGAQIINYTRLRSVKHHNGTVEVCQPSISCCGKCLDSFGKITA